MKLPAITTKQQDILHLLYRYRFLNRIQIQTLMHHKDYKTVNLWLKDLREKEYVQWIYSTDFTEKSKPAVYYLGANGIRCLRVAGIYPSSELRKRYREHERSEGFISRSLLVADSCIDLGQNGSERARYEWQTQADFADPDCSYHFLTEAAIQPQLHYTEQKGNRVGHYLLEIIDPTLPQYRLRKRLKDYVNYLCDDEWEGEDEPVIARLVLPSTYLLIYTKRRIKKLLDDAWDTDGVRLELTTVEKLTQSGVLGDIWEVVKAPNG